MNYELLSKAVNAYIKDFNSRWPNEKHKWEGYILFKNNFDINAKDFSNMLDRSIHKKQLVGVTSPRNMLISLAREEPSTIRNALIDLYDETKSIDERAEKFISVCEEVKDRCNSTKGFNWGKSAQSNNTVGDLIHLRYPEKYYWYRLRYVNNIIEYFSLGVKVNKSGKNRTKLKDYYLMLDKLNEELYKIKTLRELLFKYVEIDNTNEIINFKILTFDFVVYVNQYILKKGNDEENELDNEADGENIAYWLYSAGSNNKKLDEYLANSIMGIGWGFVGNIKNYSSINEINKALQEKTGTNKDFKNDSLCLYEFANKIEVDDVIYVKDGSKNIIARGVVTSDYIYDEDVMDTFKHLRKIEWTNLGNYEVNENLPIKTLTELSFDNPLIEELENFLSKTA